MGNCAVSTGCDVSDDPEDWLGSTRLINVRHASIQKAATRLVRNASTDRERAKAIFSFVSRDVLFGFCPGFWSNRADEVLKYRRGYCNTKGTLFVTLLRAVGIPARQVFVDIDVRVLYGIIDPRTPYLDHSFSEVFLDEKWRATDAYIVDPPLFAAAKHALLPTREQFGYGIHINGSTSWDAERASFCQFPLPVARNVVNRYHGPFSDVEHFYSAVPHAWNRLGPLTRAAFGVVASGANRRAERLRRSAN